MDVLSQLRKLAQDVGQVINDASDATPVVKAALHQAAAAVNNAIHHHGG